MKMNTNEKKKYKNWIIIVFKHRLWLSGFLKQIFIYFLLANSFWDLFLMHYNYFDLSSNVYMFKFANDKDKYWQSSHTLQCKTNKKEKNLKTLLKKNI